MNSNIVTNVQLRLLTGASCVSNMLENKTIVKVSLVLSFDRCIETDRTNLEQKNVNYALLEAYVTATS